MKTGTYGLSVARSWDWAAEIWTGLDPASSLQEPYRLNGLDGSNADQADSNAGPYVRMNLNGPILSDMLVVSTPSPGNDYFSTTGH